MNKKTIKKALLLTVCAILLVVASVMGTLAYLTSKDVVTNTFTAGKVKITLDETPVDAYGAEVSGDPVKNNSYILVPGHTYKKDPVVHVAAGSEDSYIFVTVDNGISAYEKDEDAYNTILEQIAATWTQVPETPGVYYKNYTKNNENVTDLPVFSGFTVEETLNNADLPPAEVTVTVTAYAIQKDGFADNPKGAWEALQNQLATNPD